jgi:hypothetical protein
MVLTPGFIGRGFFFAYADLKCTGLSRCLARIGRDRAPQPASAKESKHGAVSWLIAALIPFIDL